MQIQKIDLYSYFNQKKEAGNKGILTAYILDNSVEINQKRVHPSILIIPGGGYSFTSFREEEPVALKFASYGFNAFVLEYTCYSNYKVYPCVLKEALMAVKYIRENINKFQGDIHGIAGIGFSAGAHLLGLLSSVNEKELNELCFKEEDVRLDGVIFAYPVISSQPELIHEGTFYNLTQNDADLMQRLSIENRISDKFPPAFIWHTKCDSAVPYLNSVLLKECLDRHQIINQLQLYEHGEHGESLADITCYTEQQLIAVPKENANWFMSAIEFLANINIRVKDE